MYYHTIPTLNNPEKAAFWNHLKDCGEKQKLLITSNFSFSHCVFNPYGEPSAISIKFEIVVCKLFQFGRV